MHKTCFFAANVDAFAVSMEDSADYVTVPANTVTKYNKKHTDLHGNYDTSTGRGFSHLPFQTTQYNYIVHLAQFDSEIFERSEDGT